jgi:ferric enterobactin receptor
VPLSRRVISEVFLSAQASNPYLRFLNYKITTSDPRFTEITHNDIVYRRFNIGFDFQFGKLKEGSILKNKKSRQNDDIKIIPPSIPNN